MSIGKNGATRGKRLGTHGKNLTHGRNLGKTANQALPLEVGKHGVAKEEREAHRAVHGGVDARHPHMREGDEEIVFEFISELIDSILCTGLQRGSAYVTCYS